MKPKSKKHKTDQAYLLTVTITASKAKQYRYIKRRIAALKLKQPTMRHLFDIPTISKQELVTINHAYSFNRL